MTQTITELSNNAVYALTQESTESQSILVQVIEFIPKKDKFYLMLSDGCYMIKALPKDQNLLNPGNFQSNKETDLNAIIAVKKHMLPRNNVVGIMEFERVFNYKAKIGNPQEFSSQSINPQSVENFKLEKSMIDLNISSSNDQTTLKQNQVPSENHQTVKKQTPHQGERKPQTQRKFAIPPPARPLNGNLKDYETIKDLYIGMDRWTIVCRIVDLNYKEFTSKSGNQTKVLNLQLMDRTGMKISGAFFGNAAQDVKDYLIKDRVYKISQGQIRSQSYNNSKNDKLSAHKINFTALSVFEEVSDTSSIAKNEDSTITLAECVEKRIIGQEFDVVCILVNIEETVEVKKEDKLLRKTNLLVADPIKGLTIHATIWNDNLIPDSSLIGRTLILSRFKLNEFKNSLSLSSSYKSKIWPSESHEYKQYEAQTMKDYTEYEKLHEIKSTGQQQNDVCKTLRELQQKIQRLENDQWVRSDLTVYINKFGLKKWHFEGCSHCGKSAESLNNCQHCHKYVEKTVPHFILPVEICDSTGSLWTTGYDEWAKKIFGVTDQTEVINYLLNFDANKLKQQTESYLYQEFKLRISSKKDNEGRIKHHASKIYERNLVEETLKNVELINNFYMSL